MLDLLPLRLQVRQGPPPNILRLVRDPLALPQALRTPVQPLRARKQLLALLQLRIARAPRVGVWVVGVAVSEEGTPIGGEGGEEAASGVDVGGEVAERLVDARFLRGGDVLLFDAHLVELRGGKEVSDDFFL